MRAERQEHLSQVLQARRDEREILRNMLYYLRTEEERLNKLREEEEARKREGILPTPSYIKLISVKRDHKSHSISTIQLFSQLK